MKICYEPCSFRPATLALIAQANEIIEEYAAEGYDLTLRQLYYQFVSKDLIPNKQTEYKRLGDVVSKARRAGLLSWQAIVDRTRNLRALGTWESPEEIVSAVSQQFRYDRWLTQPSYVEVWYEKEALAGVFERIANQFRVPHFACRGYPSDSEVWGAAQRLRHVSVGTTPSSIGRINPGRDVVILHFGDHDPSGIDMTRDIRERLALFGARRVDVRRLALNMDQVEEYQPPPNPAKDTDSRFAGYLAEYGDESWELDALSPRTLAGIVRAELDTLIDFDRWNAEVERETQARRELRGIAENYGAAVAACPLGEVEDDATPDEEDGE